MIKNFYEEHLHIDEEIRWILDGEGFFDVPLPRIPISYLSPIPLHSFLSSVITPVLSPFRSIHILSRSPGAVPTFMHSYL